jgi:DNA-binding response OmpR family regulator
MQIDNEILIIDDNISQLKLLDKILSQAQYPVRIASNSHQALRSIAHKPPALILLDIMMPDIDGLEICRRLNAEPSTRNIPVIFISGLEDADTKVKGFNAGAVDYITKPFQTAEILVRVKTHLRLRHLQTNLEQAYAEMEERVLERTGELFQTNQALRISEQRYRSLFENTPISILEEDFSEVKIYLDELKRNGINDIETYLADHMDEVKRIRSLVKLIDINRAALEFQGIDNKCIVIKHIMECFTEETFKDYLKVFLAIWNGIQQIGFETVMKILTGEKRYISVRWSVLPGYEKTLRRVLVSVVDITNLKRSKQALQASKQQLEHSLHEKDILLQEIYHRTKNNMQVIISLLTLQSAHIRDPETLHIFRETKNRIRSMALVHKKLCQSRNLSKIDLKYYITDLTTALLKSYFIPVFERNGLSW